MKTTTQKVKSYSKKPQIDPISATDKVIEIRGMVTDDEMAEMLGMCKVTMYKRLRTKNWKKTELALIETL